MLKSADIPSVLIELGFLSTRQDLENLSDPIWRAGMAAGIRDGIQAWALEDVPLGGFGDNKPRQELACGRNVVVSTSAKLAYIYGATVREFVA